MSATTGERKRLQRKSESARWNRKPYVPCVALMSGALPTAGGARSSVLKIGPGGRTRMSDERVIASPGSSGVGSPVDRRGRRVGGRGGVAHAIAARLADLPAPAPGACRAGRRGCRRLRGREGRRSRGRRRMEGRSKEQGVSADDSSSVVAVGGTQLDVDHHTYSLLLAPYYFFSWRWRMEVNIPRLYHSDRITRVTLGGA